MMDLLTRHIWTQPLQITSQHRKLIYSVSNAVGNGLREAIAGFIVTGGLLACGLVYKKIISFGLKLISIFIIICILSLLIGVVYVNPCRYSLSDLDSSDYDKINNAHWPISLTDLL